LHSWLAPANIISANRDQSFPTVIWRWRTERNQKETGSGSFVSRVMKLANLVEYQDKAVVSRTIIDKKSGTVTLFSFDAGQTLSEHTAPFDAMVYIVDGEAEVTISGKSFHMKEGDMIIMPENRPHSLMAPKRFKMLLTMIATG